MLTIVGCGAFVYFKYGINPVSLIGQIHQINQTVNLKDVAKNQFNSSDYESACTKLNSEELIINFTDKEVGAYLSKNKELFDESSSFPD